LHYPGSPFGVRELERPFRSRSDVFPIRMVP
jgi:hypothetical protein